MAFESSAEVTLKELQEVLAVFAVSEESPRDPGGTRGSEEEVGRHTRLNLETELGLSSSAFTAQCSKLLAQLIDIDGRRGLMNPEGDGSGSAGAGSRSSASSKSLSSQAEAESPVAASVRSLAWWEQNLRFSSPKLLDSSQSEHDLSVVWDFVCGQIALRRRSPGQDSRVSLDSNNSTSTSSGPVRSVSRVGTLMSSSSLVSGKKQERGSIHSEPEGSANPRVSGQVSEILRKPGAKRQGSGRSMGSSSGLSASDRPSGSSAKKNFPSDAEEEPVLARKDSRRSSGTPQSSGTSSGTPQSSVSSSGGSFVPASAPTGSLLDKAKTRKEADGEDAACGNRETMREVGPGVQRVDAAAPATSGTESTESTSKLTRGTESTTAGPERRSAPSCFALSGSFTLFGALALVPVLYGVGMYYLLHNSGCGLVFCAPNEQADTIELLKQFLEDDGDTLRWLSEKVHHGILDYTEAAVPPTRSVEINPAASFKGSPEGGGRRRRPKFELPLLTTYWTHVSSFVAEHFSMLEAGTGLDFKTEVLDPCECCQSCQCLPLRLVYLRTGKRPVLDLSRGIRVGAPMTFVLGIPAEGKLVELVHAVPAQFSKYAGGKVPGEPERIDMWDKTLPQDWWNWSPRKAEADPNPPRFRGAPGTSSSRAFLARSSNSTYQKSTPQKKERETGVARGSPANPDTNHLRGRAWVHDLFHNLPTGRTLQQTLREGLYDRANNPRGELFDDLSNKNTRVRIGNSFLFFDCCVTCVLTCHKMKDKAFCKPINAVQRKCMPIPLLTYVGAAIRLTIQRVLELPIEALPIFVADTWTREKLLEAHLDMRYTGSISEVLRGEDVKTFSIYDDGLGASAWKEKEPGPGVRLDLHITRWFWSSGVLKEISSKTEQHEKSEAGASGPGTP
eukprot:gene452-182_t